MNNSEERLTVQILNIGAELRERTESLGRLERWQAANPRSGDVDNARLILISDIERLTAYRDTLRQQMAALRKNPARRDYQLPLI